MLAYRTTTGPAPSYFHSLLPSRSLRSASERRLVVSSQRDSKSLSRTFSFTVPGWWNDLPTPIRNAGSLSIFKQQLKTHLSTLLDLTLKKNVSLFQNLHLSFFLSLLLLLACTYLNNAWYLVLRALFASFGLIALCIPQLYVALDKSICKMTESKCKPELDHSSIMTFK